ncbi:MAG: DNA replication and repair protein RecF [candidate division WOR-3 bacterium]|jgi:DNA replication and repair protein RecF
MKIRELELINFKKFSHLKIQFSENINLIIGKNRAGKTTIIEAISYISIPRSFRNVKDEYLIKFNENGFSVKAIFSNLTEHYVLITYKKNGFKIITLDNKRVKTFLKLFEKFPVLTFHSNNYNIIEQSPEIRRKFFDWFFSILDYEYFVSLYKYKKILEQKNKALKLKSDVLIWNRQLKEVSNYIIKKREEYIEKLNSIIKEQDQNIKIEYVNSLKDKTFESVLEFEIKRGFSIIGPHRDDYKFYYKNYDSKFFSSEGEKRKIFLELSLAMIKLSKIIKNEEPIIMFDDPFSVLDENELIDLLNKIEKLNLQVIITSIRPIKINAHIINL